MKTMKWTLLFSAFSFALVVGLSGCSDDSGNPNPKPNDQGAIADTGGASNDTGGASDDTGGGGGGQGSCTVGVDPNKVCNHYVGSAYDSTVADSCTKTQGTWSTSACDTAGAVGYCSLHEGTSTEMATYYYGTMGGTMGETACTAGKGTWHTL